MDWLTNILTGANIAVSDEIMAQIETALSENYVSKADYTQLQEQTKGLGDVTALQTKYDNDTAELKKQLSAAQFTAAVDLALAKSGARNSKAVSHAPHGACELKLCGRYTKPATSLWGLTRP
ncbi:MAG: hypothetical protein ACI4SS_03250 [Clostridia bacterium]